MCPGKGELRSSSDLCNSAVTKAPGEEVVSCSAIDQIIAIAAIDGVIAAVSRQRVIQTGAQKAVIAIPGIDRDRVQRCAALAPNVSL